jgi:DNA repair exonuclease SbcCD nuclease subunit
MRELVVGAIADSQADGTWRLDAHDRAMKHAAREGRARGVGLWLHGGDVFEHFGGSTARERRSVWDAFEELADSAPVVVVEGNHDPTGEIDELRRIRTRFPIHAVAERPAVLDFHAGEKIRVRIAAIPWPRKSAILSWLDDTAPPELRKAATREALRAVFEGLGRKMAAAAEFGRRGVKIALAHAQVVGASSDSDQPLVGHDFEVALDDLALLGCDLTVLGHIHKPQEWSFDGRDVVYPGAPTWQKFATGELVPKGFVLARVAFEDELRDPMPLVSWERVPIPGVPLRLVEMTFDGSTLVAAEPRDVCVPDGSAVRLRYSVETSARLGGKLVAEGLAARWRARGCDVVIEERLVPQILARAPEIAAATSIEEKFRLFLARTSPQTPERTERLVERLRGLAAARSSV